MIFGHCGQRLRRTTEHGYTISSPCEPNGSGELKSVYAINCNILSKTYAHCFDVYKSKFTGNIEFLINNMPVTLAASLGIALFLSYSARELDTLL